MLLQKTIKAKVYKPTNTKLFLLTKEYEEFQRELRNSPSHLYSATKQQAQRFKKRLGKRLKRNKEYPLILRNDSYRVKIQDTKLVKAWIKIPVCDVWGGIWLPVKVPDYQIPLLELTLKEGKLIKRGDDWFVHIVVQKEIEVGSPDPNRILSIDLGERVVATSVAIVDDQMKHIGFHGREIRGIRRHYAWLRKRLGERKLLKVIKRVGHKEQRKVGDVLHKVSHEVVELADQFSLTIVLGDLEGIRNRSRGRKMNRIVSNMPYYKLTQMITYKAGWRGIPVVKLSEAYTSKTCHLCGERGTRPHQGLFKCQTCELEYNADLNGAINIAKRFREQVLLERGSIDRALNSGESEATRGRIYPQRIPSTSNGGKVNRSIPSSQFFSTNPKI